MVGGVKLKFIIDSGIKKNMISNSAWSVLKNNKVSVLEQNKGSDIKFLAYGQTKPLDISGRFKAELVGNGIK